MRVGIIGLGNFGSAVGNLISSNGYTVTGWDYDEEVVREVNEHRTNHRYLKGVELDTLLSASSNLQTVCGDSEVLFVALPSAFLRSTLDPVRKVVKADALIVNLAKGIDPESGHTAFQLIDRMFPESRTALLSGPSIANEFARGMATTVVLAGSDRNDLLQIAKLLDNETFRTRFSDDVVGVELGGILKNIYAIGLGLFDGCGIESINFKATYLTLSLEEITRYGVAMGARMESFLYLAGAGDLLATSMSEHSHNRYFGEMLGRGLGIEAIEEEMGVLPEGVRTIEHVLYTAEKMHVTMPLAQALLEVMQGHMNALNYIDAVVRM